jgi:Tol biopolymer transport system component/tRNA A-37 threonylcarbamoyl transferase component Bud32
MASLKSGVQIGPYEIEAPIGAGGMGEVYKARDTRLNRNVAIKILPEHISEKPEAKLRFKREAEMIAALNHPHICTLYDVGEHTGIEFLVMELLEGETLAARLERGRLPVSEVLKIAIQIADALNKAHRQGVIHRDLKPGNVMLTGNGVKLLDFGLAKLKQASQSSPAMSTMPTNPNMTADGAILGTLQYMSPEQLEGEEADSRTDIFAFGTVVYEMLTGKKAFQGKSQVSLIGAILEREPAPLSNLVPETPQALSRIIHRCFAKNPDERWQSAGDLGFELKSIAESDVRAEIAQDPAEVKTQIRSNRAPLPWILAATILFAITVTLGIFLFRMYRSQPEPAAMRFLIAAPDQTVLDGPVIGPVISPDGKRIVFTARSIAGKRTLWVRALDSTVAQSLPGTDEALAPFWSPDSRSIAFFTTGAGKLKKVDIAGGVPTNLCDANAGRGGTWNRDGIIVFAQSSGPLFRIAAAGGQPVAVTTLAKDQINHRGPSFLPDGLHFLYTAGSSSGASQGVYIASLNSGEQKRLLSSDSNAIYVQPGFLVFVQDATLLRRPFDVSKLEVTGDATPIAEGVAVDAGIAAASVSENDILVYRTGSGGNESRQLVSFDRSGKIIDRVGPPGRYIGLDWSPDGKRLAVHRHDGNGGDIWLFELMRGTMSRFTFDPSLDNSMPIWSPTGDRIVFSELRDGKWGLYQKAASGTEKEELLYESAGTEKAPMAWSPDGKYIVFEVTDPKTAWDLWVLPLTGERKANPIMQTPFNETWADISPNGKWIAYDSDETGRYEIYIRPFPSGEGKWQVSANGGWYPRWNKDGKEIFYADAAANGKLLSVRVNTAGSMPEFSAPTPLFDSGYVNISHGVHHKYAVSPDGQRFIIPRAESTMGGESKQPPITVVLNWNAGNKK